MSFDKTTGNEIDNCITISVFPAVGRTLIHRVSRNSNSPTLIERSILQTLGFKNSFLKKKDKKENIRRDKNGNPTMKDTQNDFSAAIRSLRATAAFVEGSSLDDTEAHFVIQK